LAEAKFDEYAADGEDRSSVAFRLLHLLVVSEAKFLGRVSDLTFPVKSEDSSEERCYAGVDLMIEMEWAHGFR
jgi:hypothetical protein